MANTGTLTRRIDNWTFEYGMNSRLVIDIDKNEPHPHGSGNYYGSRMFAQVLGQYHDLNLRIHNPETPNIKSSLLEIVRTYYGLGILGALPGINYGEMSCPVKTALVDFLRFLGEEVHNGSQREWTRIPICSMVGIPAAPIMTWTSEITGGGRVELYRRLTPNGYYSTKVVFDADDNIHFAHLNDDTAHLSLSHTELVFHQTHPTPFTNVQLEEMLVNHASK